MIRSIGLINLIKVKDYKITSSTQSSQAVMSMRPLLRKKDQIPITCEEHIKTAKTILLKNMSSGQSIIRKFIVLFTFLGFETLL